MGYSKVPLCEVAKFISRGITPSYTTGEGLAVINQKCIRNFCLCMKESRVHDLHKKSIHAEKMVQKNDILINSTGMGTLGRVTQVMEDIQATVDSHITIVRVNSENDPIFVGYAVKNQQKAIEALAEGSTGQTELSRIRLGQEIFIPQVPKAQQKEIGEILLYLDEKILQNAAINDNLQQQARALYQDWFVDFAPFGGIKPIDWKIGKLKDVLRLKRDAIKAGDKPLLPYLPIDVIPMNTFAVTDFKSNDEAQSSLITFDKDDIVIGAMRVYFHRVILAPCEGITRTTCFTLTPFDSAFLSFALLSCDQDSSIDYAQTTSKGSTMPYAVWDGGLGDMEIVIPTRESASKFNELVLPMLRQIQSSYFENLNLRTMRDTLLPKLMSGEIDVSEVEI